MRHKPGSSQDGRGRDWALRDASEGVGCGGQHATPRAASAGQTAQCSNAVGRKQPGARKQGVREREGSETAEMRMSARKGGPETVSMSSTAHRDAAVYQEGEGTAAPGSDARRGGRRHPGRGRPPGKSSGPAKGSKRRFARPPTVARECPCQLMATSCCMYQGSSHLRASER